MPTANFNPSRSRIAPLMVKLETTYGSDSSPSPATDDILSFDSPVPWQIDVSSVEYRMHEASFTRHKDLIGPRFGRMSFKTLFQGSGSAGSVAVNGFKALDALLQSCGIASTASGNIIYAPASLAGTPPGVNLKSVTIYANHQGMLHKLTGAYGTCIMTGNPRTGLECEFQMIGLYNAPAAVGTTFNGWTGGTLRALPFLNVGGTITPLSGSPYSMIFKSFRWDHGTTVEQIENCNDTHGIECALFADRNPKLDVVIAQDNYASAALTYPNVFANLLASVTHAAGWAVNGGTGNTCTFAFPTAQLIPGTNPQVNAAHREVKLAYKVQHVTPETEFSITIT